MAVEVIEIKDANSVNQRVAVDKVGTDNVQIVKVAYGADDTFTLASSSSGLPVNVVAGAAAGTEYTEGATDATISGTAVLWEDSADTLRPVSAAKPLPVAQTGTATVVVDDTDAVEVRGNTTVLRPTVTGSTTAYSIGDVVGGEITLTNLTRTISGGAVLNTITLWSDDALTPKLDILFFDADLTGGTYTDNGALTLSTADKQAILGVVEVATTDWKTVAGDTWVTTPPIGLPLKGNGTSDLRMIIVTQTAMTLTATTGLTATLGLLRD